MSTRSPRRTSKAATWVLVLASVASLMAALDAMVVSSALTTIRLDLGASIEQLEWTVNAYNLVLAVLLLPAAALGDRYAASSVVGAVAADEVGKAAGANSMLRELGGVLGIAVLVAVFAGAGSYASAQAFVDGFGPAMAGAAVLSLAGAIAALGLPGRPRAAPVPHPVPAV